MVKDFRQFQFEFARHLRQPHVFPKPPTISLQSVEIYQRARLARVKEVLALVFVRCHAVLGHQTWNDLVDYFYWHWPTHGTRQNHVPHAFVSFLDSYPATDETPAWVADFARFEWLQWRVSAMSVHIPNFDPSADLMSARAVLNPAREQASFDWPVHQIDADCQPTESQPTLLWVVRDSEDELRVVLGDTFRAQLISLLQTGLTGEQALQAMASWLNHPKPQELLQEGQQILIALQQSQVILGAAVD